jgi:hypothetical protein
MHKKYENNSLYAHVEKIELSETVAKNFIFGRAEPNLPFCG